MQNVSEMTVSAPYPLIVKIFLTSMKQATMACSLRIVPFLSYLVNDPARFFRPPWPCGFAVPPTTTILTLAFAGIRKDSGAVIVAPFHAGRVTPAPRGEGGGQSLFFRGRLFF